MEKVTYPIEELVPHRRPMMLLDAMIEGDENRGVCLATPREDAAFRDGDVVPAFAGIEYMAQAIAAHGGYMSKKHGEPVKVGFLLGTTKLTAHVPHFPLNRTMRIEAEHEWGNDQLMRFICSIRDHETGEILQEAKLNVFQPNELSDYLSESGAPEDAIRGGI